ncbi:helix-turn-helix domain-containing protein, partial [Aeromonas caviae]
MAKVLIVDDHPAIRMAVNMLLKQEEHHVLGEVDNGVDVYRSSYHLTPASNRCLVYATLVRTS